MTSDSALSLGEAYSDFMVNIVRNE